MAAPFCLKFSGVVVGISGSASFKFEQDWLRYKKLLLMATLCDIEKNDKFWRHFHGEVRAWGMLGFPQHFYLIILTFYAVYFYSYFKAPGT